MREAFKNAYIMKQVIEMMSFCSNCSNPSSRLLNKADSSKGLLPTSDGQFMDRVTAKRTLCQRCACIEVHYNPPDRLQEYFKYQYDTSDTVQNNVIILNGKKIKKHSIISDYFFSTIENSANSGEFLEIGCGQGYLINRFNQRFPNCKCTGIDPALSLKSSNDGSVRFIKDVFDAKYFRKSQFDIVAAHGFLNRAETLSHLIKIKEIIRPGALLSFEVAVMEQSLFSPYIWDHPYMYSQDVFEAYLRYVGFKIVKKIDYIASLHYICLFEPGTIGSSSFGIETKYLENTERIYNSHLNAWKIIEERFFNAAYSLSGKTLGLFGAGVFTAALLSLVGKNEISFILDEFKYGKLILGIPVVNFHDVKDKKNAHIMVCIRPEYQGYVVAKLNQEGFSATPLMS